MPIINCPECNGKISSTVKHCIHCGAPITVCPECGGVYAEKHSTCPQCGYAFQKAGGKELASDHTNSNADRQFTASEIHQY